MGCVSSKKLLRTTSFQENSNRRFPSVADIPLLEDLVLANSHEFLALICKVNKLAKKRPRPSEPENILNSVSKDYEGERLNSGNHVRVNSDLQSESLLKGEKSEKHEVAEGESEEYKATEEEKAEIIFTSDVMEGLDNGQTCHVSRKTGPDSDSLFANSSEIFEELIDKNGWARISRSKSLQSFHTVEEYDAFLARRKRPLWDRNSKRHLYYLAHAHIETIDEFSSRSVSQLYSCPPISLGKRNINPVVIDSKEEPQDDDNCSFEFAVVHPSFELRDTKNEVKSNIPQTASENNISEETNGTTQTVSANKSMEENNGIAQAVSENNSREENNGIPETISENSGSKGNSQGVETKTIGNTDMPEENLEKDQSIEANSGKRRMYVRDKLNDLGGIIIPSTSEFSAFGSFKKWLTGGGHLYSPGVSTGLSLGYSKIGDKWSMANDAGNCGQPSIDAAQMETDYYYPVLNIDGNLANDGVPIVYSDCGVSARENNEWDCPLFDPEVLDSFEKAIEQLSEEEQHLLRQIDEDSNLLRGKSCAKGSDFMYFFN